MSIAKKFRLLYLPLEGGREKLRNEALIVRTKLLRVDAFVALAVKVVGIESLDSCQELSIVFVAEMFICPFTMPRIETMVPDHSEPFWRKCALVPKDVVEVL